MRAVVGISVDDSSYDKLSLQFSQYKAQSRGIQPESNLAYVSRYR